MEAKSRGTRFIPLETPSRTGHSARDPFLPRLLKKLARRAGATVLVEPKYGFAGQITFKNGVRRYFRNTCLDLNPLGATEIAKDKAYADFFLRNMGYRTVGGKTFFSPDWCRAIGSRKNPKAAAAYAKKIGFPVYVKPNSLSQGELVCKAYAAREFKQAVAAIIKKDRVFLVQRPTQGRDARIVVLDGSVISAYERFPLSVEGDGKSTILSLLKKRQKEFERQGRDTRINFRDFRIANRLRRLKLRPQSVPAKGAEVVLLDNANLSTGGRAVDVTAALHPSFKKLAVRATADMGLRLCGVDILTEGDIHKPCRAYRILEINAAPGLDHYASYGPAQKKLVENMYLRVLRAMRKS